MSRYDDPRWYEEQDPQPQYPRQPAYDNLGPSPTYGTPDNNNGHSTRSDGYSYYMSPSPRAIMGRILGLIIMVAIAFLAGWFAHELFGNQFTSSDQSTKYAQLVQQAWETVDQNYVDRKAIDYKTMAYSSIQAMVDSLKDKGHTRFLTPEQKNAENQQLDGEFIGIGVNLDQDEKTKEFIITSPIPGSPAEKAGLKAKDIILSVNGTRIKGKTLSDVSKLIQGKEGTDVKLTIQRPGQKEPLNFTITRAKIKVTNVFMHYIKESQIAHIQVVQFSDGVAQQVKEAQQQAKKLGAKKIILDLRDNRGGYLNEAEDMVSQFIKSGNVLLEQDSSGKRTPVPVSGDAINTTDTMVVLVNGNSASASEIVSGSLQDNGRAIIIGTKTFGTGTVLQQYGLSDGSAILIGIREWLTPKGNFIRDEGIQPNIVVTLPEKAPMVTANDANTQKLSEKQLLDSGDTQLEAAIKYLKEH